MSRAILAYADAVTEQFPAIRATAIHATGLVNGPSSPALLDEYRAEQQAASERLTATAIADIPSIAAWRRAFAQFGAKPTQYRNAAEALLRRLKDEAGLGVPPVERSTEPAVREILRQIAAADAALATGHLTPEEVQWLVAEAVASGVRRITITHGSWRVPTLSTEQLLRLADQGAIIEITAIQYLDGSSSPADLADLARRLGGERCILTSDAGQPANDWSPKVLADFKATLEHNGLPQAEADKMVTTTPRSLVDDTAL